MMTSAQPTLTIFTTGGTFDKVYFDANSQFSIGDPQVEPLLVEANVDLDYRVEPLLRKDSLELTDADRENIARHVADSTSRHIVVIHGTDTMVATAAAIAHKAVEGKTIILVGAMQPARMRYSDAPFNVGFAIAAAQLSPLGIYIAMNGKVFPHDNVVKNVEAGQFQTLAL